MNRIRLLVVSDSHGQTTELKDLQTLYQNQVDAMFHCGDSQLLADQEELKGFLTVRGNCDHDGRFPLEFLHEIDNHRIFVTHGHHYNVKMTWANLAYKAKEVGADFVFYGHSHYLSAIMDEGTLLLNPGSIFFPRGRVERTYAIVEKAANKIDVSFYTHEHEELLDLRQQFLL